MNFPIRNCSKRRHGRGISCSWLCLTTLLMAPTISPAPQWAAHRWGHLAASPLYIQIAWEVSNHCIDKIQFNLKQFCSIYITCFETFLMQLMEKSHKCNENSTSEPRLYHQCAPPSDGYDGWCYTRSHLNNSAILGQWGYCVPNCSIQTSTQNAAYNLASQEHDDLWSENIVSLEALASGHCHTYNPVNVSFSGNQGQFYTMLGGF